MDLFTTLVYYKLHDPRDATGQFFFALKIYIKKLRFKSVRSFYKFISKSLGFACNV